MSSSSKTRNGKRKTRENVEIENVQNTDENSFDIENIEPEVPQAETPSKKLKEEMFKALKVNIEESEKRMSKMIRDVLGTVLRERDENVPSSSSSSNIVSESENEVNSVIDISNETANSRNNDLMSHLTSALSWTYFGHLKYTSDFGFLSQHCYFHFQN